MNLPGPRKNRGEWLAGGWFEWLWGALLFAAVAVLPFFMPVFQDDGSGSETLWGFVVLFTVPLACEASQYTVTRAFGARPKFGWFRFSWRSALGSPWTAEGHSFSTTQFAALCQRPFLVVLAVTALYLVFTPVNGWWMPSLLLYVASETRRMWFYFLSLRQPPGTLIEETSGGTLVYRPEVRRDSERGYQEDLEP